MGEAVLALLDSALVSVDVILLFLVGGVPLFVVVSEVVLLLLVFLVAVGLFLLLAGVGDGGWFPRREEFVLEVEDPGVLEHPDERDSLLGTFDEELGDEVFVLLRNLGLELDIAGGLRVGDCFLLSAEGCMAVY